MIYLEIYKNCSYKINIINFMENFTKILFRFLKGVFLEEIFLWKEPLRKIGFRKKKCFELKKIFKTNPS